MTVHNTSNSSVYINILLSTTSAFQPFWIKSRGHGHLPPPPPVLAVIFIAQGGPPSIPTARRMSSIFSIQNPRFRAFRDNNEAQFGFVLFFANPKGLEPRPSHATYCSGIRGLPPPYTMRANMHNTRDEYRNARTVSGVRCQVSGIEHTPYQ